MKPPAWRTCQAGGFVFWEQLCNFDRAIGKEAQRLRPPSGDGRDQFQLMYAPSARLNSTSGEG
jgi:hypothetical protein